MNRVNLYSEEQSKTCMGRLLILLSASLVDCDRPNCRGTSELEGFGLNHYVLFVCMSELRRLIIGVAHSEQKQYEVNESVAHLVRYDVMR